MRRQPAAVSRHRVRTSRPLQMHVPVQVPGPRRLQRRPVTESPRRGRRRGHRNFTAFRSRGGGGRGRRGDAAEGTLDVVAAASTRSGAILNALPCVRIGVASESGVGVKELRTGVGAIVNACAGGMRRICSACKEGQRRSCGGGAAVASVRAIPAALGVEVAAAAADTGVAAEATPHVVAAARNCSGAILKASTCVRIAPTSASSVGEKVLRAGVEAIKNACSGGMRQVGGVGSGNRCLGRCCGRWRARFWKCTCFHACNTGFVLVKMSRNSISGHVSFNAQSSFTKACSSLK